MSLHFTKMHGIGNDFVVLDCRTQPFALEPTQIARIADRHTGVGFDQLLTIEPARDPSCLFYYGIYNADGSMSGQCGNGVRCVAAWLRRAGVLGTGTVRLESPSGPVSVELLADGRVRVDMGEPRFLPEQIPLTLPATDPYALGVGGERIEFGAVSMGNPHAVVEVADVAAAPLARVGAALSTNAHFPQSCNVGVVQVVDRAQVRLRVRERGVGETLACGTGACAAVAVLRRRAQVDATVAVDLPGGRLEIRWDGPGHALWMTGPAAFVFEGNWNE
ncbi:diaminopimelate epimerase [Rudaea sp.]|uniref:diaminopimelate epimerase n=1 Tax=Rudaea sp. TaxID=2136325 RepID=UPI002ED54B76